MFFRHSLRIAVPFTALFAIGALSGAATGTVAVPGSDLMVEVEGLRSHKGMLRICLTSDKHHFPDCESDPDARKLSVSSDTPNFEVRGLTPGRYALLVMHDENNNAKLDSFAGIPREGVGFSRNPRLRFGPPAFEAVTFQVDRETAYQSVQMKYFL